MSGNINEYTFVLDRSVAVAFGIWGVDIGIFFQNNSINLAVPEEALMEFINGESQQGLWSLSVSGVDKNQSTAGGADNAGSAVSSVFINPQGYLTTLSGINACPVQISSVTLPIGTLVRSDDYYLALASTLQSNTSSSVFLCSDDKPMAKASATANISHLWSMDILCLMYDKSFISGQKARRVYEKVRRIDARHIPKNIETFRNYYNSKWISTKRDSFLFSHNDPQKQTNIVSETQTSARA